MGRQSEDEMAEAIVTSVDITVGKPPDGDCTMVMSYDKKKPIERKYDEWGEASRQAAAIAYRAGLDGIGVSFALPRGEVHLDVETPNIDKGERVGPVMALVERRLERRGFESNYITGGMWVVHRPDPVGSYSVRAYFDAATMIELGAMDSSEVDEAIARYSSNKKPTRMENYRNLRSQRGDSMATKKAAKAPAKKETVTVKVGGKEFSLSPKQAEVWEQIQKRSSSGKPLGSDDERLSDPDSIAAMKLATEIGVAHRHKFGTRWHYFDSKGDMDKAVKAYEKEAAEAAAIKEASKRKSTKTDEGKSAGAGKATGGKKKSGPLKKPSEK